MFTVKKTAVSVFWKSFLPCALILFSTFINSCNQKEKPSSDPSLEGSITISGAFALYPLIADLSYRFRISYPEVRIHVIPGSSMRGKTEISFFLTDIGLYSRNPDSVLSDFWEIKIARDAVVPIINSGHPDRDALMKHGMKNEVFAGIFTDTTQIRWKNIPYCNDPHPVSVYHRSDACGASNIWSHFLDITPASFTGIGVYGDPGMIQAIMTDPYSIGYVNLRYAYNTLNREIIEQIMIVPIDFNDNNIIDEPEQLYSSLDHMIMAIDSGLFPSPPARDLYLITKKKPTDRISLTFLRWILGEGQDYIETNGYARLDEQALDHEIKKLK